MMNGCPRWSFLTVPLLAALGCSDPVPRPPQANLTLSIKKPPSGSGSCPVTGMTYQVGNPTPPTLGPPPQEGKRVISGEHGASIQCSVKGSGPFTFSANIKATTTTGDPLTVSVTNGVINADKATGTAQLNVYTKELSGSFISDTAGCTVGVVGDNVKPGSIWVSISCESIKNSSTAQECSVDPVGSPKSSNFILENCDGS
jgi:hypothetical protein